MKHADFFKKLLAGTLAALIGLSALSGVIMAFAAEKYDYDYELETTSDSTVYVEDEDDFALVVPEESVAELRLEFADLASFTVKPDSGSHLWAGWSGEYNTIVEELGEKYGASFDVLDFTFGMNFKSKGTLTFATKNPYLYRLSGKTLVPLESTYADGVHTLQTDKLDCFLASNTPIVP